MKAWIIRRYGKDVPFELVDLSDPVPGENEVLVEIRACGLNPVDFKMRDGALRAVEKYRMPLVLGNECAGVVLAAGAGAGGLEAGQPVYARVPKETLGTFAEKVVIRADVVAPIPPGLAFDAAAGIPLVGLTSWQALLDEGKLAPGQKVFIPAGSGGVGSFAIQLAKAKGAYVATTTSASNVEMVRALGADQVIDYTREDFSKVLSGFDLVFDTLGGENRRKAFGILKRGGRLVSIVGAPTGSALRKFAKPKIVQLLADVLSWKTRSLARKHGVSYEFLYMRPDGAQLREIGRLIEAGKIRPVIDQVFRFEELPRAIERMESGRAKGKIIVSRAGKPA